jgi:hypothetical protein
VKKLFTRVGYLLGLKYEDADSPILFEITNAIVEISADEYLTWVFICSNNHAEHVTQENIVLLIEKGLLIETNSNEELRNELFKRKSLRQGMGCVVDFKYNVTLDKSFTFSKLQIDIWRKSNGCLTVGEIFEELTRNEPINLDEFIGEVMNLYSRPFIFIY